MGTLAWRHEQPAKPLGTTRGSALPNYRLCLFKPNALAFKIYVCLMYRYLWHVVEQAQGSFFPLAPLLAGTDRSAKGYFILHTTFTKILFTP